MAEEYRGEVPHAIGDLFEGPESRASNSEFAVMMAVVATAGAILVGAAVNQEAGQSLEDQPYVPNSITQIEE